MLVWVYKCFLWIIEHFSFSRLVFVLWQNGSKKLFCVYVLVNWQKLFHIFLSIAENINLFTDTFILILTEISKKILDKEVAMVKWQDNSEDFLQKLKVHCHNMIQRAYFITGPWTIKYENEEKYFLFQPSSSPLSYHR